MNFKSHGLGIYTAYTQNGFNNSLYEFYEEEYYEKSRIRKAVENFPKSYPSTYKIQDLFFECGRIYITEIDVEKLVKSLGDIWK